MASLLTRVRTALGLVSLLGLLLCPGLALAQSNGDGSIYSRFGLGSLQTFSSPQSQAMGGGAYAVRSLNYNPTANPALWSDQIYTRLSLGGSYETVTATSDQDGTSQLAAGSVEALQFSFPLYDRTLGVGLSFQPFTQHNYRTRRSGTLPESDGSSYDLNFRGGGGLHSFRGGLGYRINEALRVGASVDVIFGILERRRSTTFDQDDGLQDTRVNDETRLAGVGGTFGAHLALADVLQSDDALSIGAAVSLPTTLNGKRVLTLSEERAVSSDTLSGPINGDVSLPWRGRLGIAYQPDDRWTVTVDGLYEPWSRFSSSFSTASAFAQRFPAGGEETLTDRWRLSAGTEFMPAGDDQFTGYFQRVAYRFGTYTERLYVQPDGTTDLQTYAVTGGLSLPTALSGTRIDLNLHAGTRGTNKDAFVRDRFYGVSLHINFGEEWFQKRKLR
jgi:long-subunit fatty acid transport protein